MPVEGSHHGAGGYAPDLDFCIMTSRCKEVAIGMKRQARNSAGVRVDRVKFFGAGSFPDCHLATFGA